MQGPEKVVCCSLCLCLAVAVLSSVSLVYLTFIVYMPAKREMLSGLLEIPVICTTVEKLETDQCDWASCFEWCLSKPNHCVQLWAEVRKNGSQIAWSGCRAVEDTICPVSDRDLVEDMVCDNRDEDCEPVNKRFKEKCQRYKDCSFDDSPFVCEQKQCVSRRETRNCKRDGQCIELDHQYFCDNGLCQNLSRVMECDFTDTGDTFDCRDKRNCITITGLFDCTDGLCQQITWPWECRRKCPDITMANASIILVSGDRTVTAECEQAANVDTGDLVWERTSRHSSIFLVSCTDVFIQSTEADKLRGLDCVNGTLLPHKTLANQSWNWTSIRETFSIETSKPQGRRMEVMGIPHTHRLTIFNRTKLYVNTEMCVNTLQYECTTFFVDHRRDGRNHSSRDTYQCFYNPDNKHFVSIRFDLATTKHYFLLSFAIPASLWIVSCSCLVSSNKILRISETTGQMRLRCRRRSVSPSEDILDCHLELADSDSEDMTDPQVKERVCKRRMAVVMD